MALQRKSVAAPDGLQMPERRRFLRIMSSVLAAPLIVRAANIMPVRPLRPDFVVFGSSGSLPAGLVAGQSYYVMRSSATLRQFSDGRDLLTGGI